MMVQGSTNQRVIRFGLAGLGNAGGGLLGPLMKNPNFKITAAARRNVQALEQFKKDFNAEAFGSVEDLCKSPNVDAIYVATPTHLHTEHVQMAADYHKHVIVEKPVAIALEEADKMIEAMERSGTVMVVGHAHGFDPPIKKIREIVRSGELGRLRMIHNLVYKNWIYNPRNPDELDVSLGGGVTFRQGAHQFDVLRVIGGGMVRSVRASTAIWDESRPVVGAQVVFLEFEDGTPATAVFSGYAHFDSAELTFGIGEGGQEVDPNAHARGRAALKRLGNQEAETQFKQSQYYGAPGSRRSISAMDGGAHQSVYGLLMVSCDKGDIRQSPDGLLIYGDEQNWEVPLPKGVTGRDLMLQEFYDAVVHDKPPTHDGRWAKGGLEVTLAVLQSGRERRELFLKHQVPTRD